MENIIYQWIKSLIKGKPNQELFSSQFEVEDGMNLQEYITYEKYQFDTLSDIYDLDENFTIKVLHTYEMKDRNIVYFYIINKYEKIVCKMSLTVETSTGLLTSNNSLVQAVPKFTIENNNITQIGLAIKPKHALKKVFSNMYDLVSFHQGDNYEQDFFYTAKFEAHDNIQNQLLFFTFVLEGEKVIIERKPIFFDIFCEDLKPFKVENNTLTLLDEKYPVHLSTWSFLGKNENYEYPRKLNIDLKDKVYFTVTDSIDNDWIIRL